MVRALRDARSDPLTCPGYMHHPVAAKTYSVYVVHFQAIIQMLWPAASIVWDWVDIPGLRTAHFDATVIWPPGQHAAHRFESDAWSHFNPAKTHRDGRDAIKDDRCNVLGAYYLRLHMDDLAAWPVKIWTFVTQIQGAVKYTPAFQSCLPLWRHVNIM